MDIKDKFSGGKKVYENIINLKDKFPVEISIKKISDVKAKSIHWLWKDRLAYGKMTLFAGEPGVGKSQLLLYIASVVSNGGRFHHEMRLCDAQKVLLISGEDNADDTIKPRLMALNATLDNIHFVEGIKNTDKNGNPYFDPICLVEHLSEIEELIIKESYRVIIVDPISLHLGSVDENKNKEIRGALSRIGALAERHNLCFILNSHFSKPSGNTNKNAIYRVMGSIGFAAAARIVYGIMKDPDDPSRRLFIPIKNNVGQDKEGYVYKIESVCLENKLETSKISWLTDKIDKTANEILNNVSERKSPQTDKAIEFLLKILKNGSMPRTEIVKLSLEEGIANGRLYDAKKALNIYETQSIGVKRGKIWMLP